MTFINKLKKAIVRPSEILPYSAGLLGGYYYKLTFWVLGKRVAIGKNFQVRGRLTIKGPGRVIIGNDVYIDGRGHPVTPFTYHPEAVIQIKDQVYLNGTRMGCRKLIEIGEHCLLGDARMSDTDFHGVHPDERYNPSAVLCEPISIGKNVWIGAGVFILKGVNIGDNSVIGAGSVVTNDILENCVAVGNPARVVKTFCDYKQVEVVRE